MRSDLIAEINVDALGHNFRALKSRCKPGTKMCPALKANAYGHGVRIVAPALQEAGADMAGVATLAEAIELREIGWRMPILVFGHVLAVGDATERRERIAAMLEHNLTATIADEEIVRHIAELRPAKPLMVQLKVDTGMGRMGCMPESVLRTIRAIRECPYLRLAGLYSHFGAADLEQRSLVDLQLQTYRELLDQVSDFLPPGTTRHLANSAATITLPEAHFDMVRPGVALYGYLPAAHMASQISLRPILRLLSHLSFVKTVPAGHCVGYGQSVTTERETRLGIVPMGYADGFLRRLSSNGIIGTPLGRAPIMGRISMDQMAVDLTELPPMAAGTPVELVSDQAGAPNSVESLATLMGTISYEVTCVLGRRIDRQIVRDRA